MLFKRKLTSSCWLLGQVEETPRRCGSAGRWMSSRIFIKRLVWACLCVRLWGGAAFREKEPPSGRGSAGQLRGKDANEQVHALGWDHCQGVILRHSRQVTRFIENSMRGFTKCLFLQRFPLEVFFSGGFFFFFWLRVWFALAFSSSILDRKPNVETGNGFRRILLNHMRFVTFKRVSF